MVIVVAAQGSRCASRVREAASLQEEEEEEEERNVKPLPPAPDAVMLVLKQQRLALRLSTV
jgi:hypothetical protein